MRLSEAVEVLAPAVDARYRVWADLGAGKGTFTEALAHIAGAGATIHAVDNDVAAVAALHEVARGLPPTAARIVPIAGDIAELDRVRALDTLRLDGVLLANVLHYFAAPERILRAVGSRIEPAGRIVVVEYDRPAANPWVPHPIPMRRMPEVARAAGLAWHGVASQRPSRYGGLLYCGVLAPAAGGH